MVEDWTLDNCVELLRAFSAGDAQSAWENGLKLLATWGIREVAEGESEACLTIQLADRQMRFAGPPMIDKRTRSGIELALATAGRRLDDAEQKASLEERLKMLSQASFEGLLIHENGNVLHVNERLCEILNRPEAELHGTNVIPLCVAPDDQPEVMRRMKAGYEGAYVLRGVRSDGSMFLAELQSKQGHLGERPIRVVAVRDVTEREEMLDLLRESEARLRYLADAMFDLTVLSRGGIILEVKGPLLKEIGYSSEHLVGRKILDFIAPSAQYVSKRRVEESLPGRYETLLVDAAGSLVPIETIAVNSSLNGRPVRVAGIRDLRQARRQEIERQALQHRVERAQRTESLGVLAGGIAHDFNNLLVTVLGNAELLVEEAVDDESRTMLQSIVIAAERAAELTTRLLVYAGRGELGPPTPFNVSNLFEELVRLLINRETSAQSIQSCIASGCYVVGDRASLTQVLLNLMTNALDASLTTKTAIDVRLSKVTSLDSRWDEALGATIRPGTWIMIEVEDFGIGMDAVTQSRVFEPFFTTKRTGHGLGMAGCLGIVENHKGALHVRSELGKGTCFSLLLPAAEASDAKPTSNESQLLKPCRVLVVDDESMVREQMRRTLTLRGYGVTEAESGHRCFELLEQQEFDVILMDIIMPEMSGTEVVAEIRARGIEVPIVFVSGYFEAVHERGLENLSFQGFLRKPYSIHDLVQAVEAARNS